MQEAADLRLGVHLAGALLEAADEHHRPQPLACDLGLRELVLGHVTREATACAQPNSGRRSAVASARGRRRTRSSRPVASALETGDWAAARDAFAAAARAPTRRPRRCSASPTPCGGSRTSRRSQRRRERAYAALRRAARLAAGRRGRDDAVHQRGPQPRQLAAARGWLGRAARLVADHGLAAARGLDPARPRRRSANEDGAVAEAHDLARAAAAAARASATPTSSCARISLVGGTLVKLGRDRGRRGAARRGDGGRARAARGSPDTAVYASCVTVAACSLAAELARALRWIRAAEDFNRRYGSVHLYAVCRAHHGSVLFAAGRWDEAEAELERALRTATAGEPAQRVRALAALAELRLAQGRVEEAARLLDGHGRPARRRLARSGPSGSRGRARGRGRRARPAPARRCGSRRRLGAAAELLAAADLAQGDVAAAEARARRVAETGAERGSDVIAAPGERALGRVLAATGEHDAAVDRLERALAAFVRLELPYEAARTRLALAARWPGAGRGGDRRGARGARRAGGPRRRRGRRRGRRAPALARGQVRSFGAERSSGS